MADTTGRIERIKIGDDFCFFDVRDDADDSTEVFVLWLHTEPPSAYLRVVESHQVGLLREAVSGGHRVTVVHEEASPFVQNLQLRPALT
jgi:hypothetical protein